MAKPEDPTLRAAFDAVMTGRLTPQQAAEHYAVNRKSLGNKLRRARKAGRAIKVEAAPSPAPSKGHVLDMQGKHVVIGPGRLASSMESVDAKAKRLIRQAVERNLQIAAYSDLEVNGQLPDGALANADPARAKAASTVVAILTDKVPGILGLEKNTGDTTELPDLTTQEGIAEAEALFESLPADIKKALVKIA